MAHYNKDYFDWQKEVGKVGGYLNKFKFENDVNEKDVLMDFGCGGGYLLKQFDNKNKIGFEINKAAQEECKKNSIPVYDNFDDIKDNSIDTIISNHAMEHVPLPLNILKELYKKLINKGKLIIVIPCEQIHEDGFHYKPNNINQHLHTWCPMTFGNLVTLAGFKVNQCVVFQHQWCPDYKQNWNKSNFHDRCHAYAKQNHNYQIRLLATKE
jgi:SAM-dependent methyltransferase